MALSGQLWYITEGQDADTRLVRIHDDGTHSTIINDNGGLGTGDNDFPSSAVTDIGVDTAAGIFFAILNAASPGSLPRLQLASFGSAVMGFGDLFVAATLGALLACDRRLQLRGAALVAVFALGFDLLFFAVDQLPATVPVALALATLELSRSRQIRAG